MEEVRAARDKVENLMMSSRESKNRNRKDCTVRIVCFVEWEVRCSS